VSRSEAVLVQHEPFHRVIFEDSGLRVIEANLCNGDTTLLHTHPLDNVTITIKPGRLWARGVNGPRVEFDVVFGRAVYNRAPYTHWVGNDTDPAVRMVHIEFLAAAAATETGERGSVPETHVLELVNEFVRIYRLALPPGARVPAHLYDRPVVLVALADEVRAGTRVLLAGDFSWHSDGAVPDLENASARSVELVLVERRAVPVPDSRD
jgi:quercetin dioxygenase-like cupin family protein